MSEEEEDVQPSVEATEDWVVDRCGIAGDITACTQLALPGYTTAFPKIHSLGTSLISFAGLTSLDVSRNCLASFEGLSSLSQLQRLNFYFNQVVALEDLARLRANRKLTDLDCRLNPMARNHPDFRLHALHTLPQLQRLDERDVRPAERRQALAFAPAGPGSNWRKESSERSSWSSNGATGAQEHESASLQRAARALLQQDDDDEDDDGSSYSESDREPRYGVESRRAKHDPARRHPSSTSWYGRADPPGAQDYSSSSTAPRTAMYGIQPPHLRHNGSPPRSVVESSNAGRESSFDQAPQAVAAALAKCESEQRRRQAAEAELDELRAHMRTATQETARLRQELADATSTAAAESAERETEGAETLRWRQRAEAAETRLAKVEEDGSAQRAKYEVTVLEVDRLQQQLTTLQELHGTMVEERTELMAQVTNAKSMAQTAATAAADREKKAVAESRALRKEITVAERYLEVRAGAVTKPCFPLPSVSL
ncbi:hypothetical protein N9K47_00185 [bacterium]|nr:hypothetical protein [bacterium]